MIKFNSSDELLRFLDSLSEFLGNTDGQTTEEIESELIEELGEERYLKCKEDFMKFIDNLRKKYNDGR